MTSNKLIKNIIMSWDPFKIHEIVEISNSEKLVDLINENDFDFFSISYTSNQHLKFESNISLGVGSINNMFSQSISIEALITTLISTLLMGVIFYQQFVLENEIPFGINCILLPFVILFFNYIYFVQEKRLLEQIRSVLLVKECIVN